MPPKGYELSAQAKENIRKGILKWRSIEARIDRNELYSLYWDKQLCAREIAGLKGVVEQTVFTWLWHYNIPRRSPQEFASLHWQNHPAPIGNLSSSWRGGRTKHQGYIYVHIYPDNRFYCMAQKGGWVAEHRVVMAQHLGRPLEPWEIVHHKGNKYPQGSIEDKGDNRIENLNLYPDQASHVTHTMFKRELHKHDKEIRLLKWQIKTLNQQLRETGVLGANAKD